MCAAQCGPATFDAPPDYAHFKSDERLKAIAKMQFPAQQFRFYHFTTCFFKFYAEIPILFY
jgi:hypothetical protein